LRKKLLLDAGFLASYFAGVDEARDLLLDVLSGRAEAYMCEVNVAEFIYNYARVFGWEAARVKHELIRRSPIKFISPDEELTVEAARLKLEFYSTLSLADCYLLALAKRLKAHVVTTERTIGSLKLVKTIYIAVDRSLSSS